MYVYIKALHVFVVVTAVGGMLAVALTLRLAEAPVDDRLRRFLVGLRAWDGLVTTPALAVVWMAGYTMAFGGGWDTAPWLLVKLGPATLLTGLHLAQGAALARCLADGLPPPAVLRTAPAVILGSLAAIAWLAVVKPL
ncbi:CopD family protein [Methylobrevis pamukkalensis]|uniref:Protoporphyrinogen IX oxidase n=1 Tax=Methylobrevis pamukkalensis TaxID=1439726 RepID=A0A1E3HA08_9HYPH|nr:hypothetical protein [Methylobrevis pamukkalensis]ODN72596.1 hypothetical protein A6302_00088 [Methylobrevis pamukkalensis]